MPKVTYIEYGGASYEIELSEGWSLMQGAIVNGIIGIEGECGGACACATCHVYIDEAYLGKLDPPNEDEEAMLEDTAAERRDNSRLGCQIPVTPELDGIVVRVPESQY